MSAIDEAWAAHDDLCACLTGLSEESKVYVEGPPDWPAMHRLLELVREAEQHLVGFLPAPPPPETAPDQEAAHLAYTQLRAENAHLRAALNRMRDLGHGMSRSWYVREIEDGLTFPPDDHET